MPLNPKEIYGFPKYPMTEETQTAEQDIKKAALDGVGGTDSRLEKLLKGKKRRKPKPSIDVIEIEFGAMPEAPTDEEYEGEESPNPKKKLDQEIAETKMDVITPDSYFNKHIVESLTSGDPGMMALGLDCFKEIIGLLCEEKRSLIKSTWQDYFENDEEFKKLEKGKTSDRLQTIYDSEVEPLMMKKEEK